jgi:hypothetical protein
MKSAREANDEFVTWFERWRAELKSRVLDERTLREEGQTNCQNLAGIPSTSRNDGE